MVKQEVEERIIASVTCTHCGYKWTPRITNWSNWNTKDTGIEQIKTIYCPRCKQANNLDLIEYGKALEGYRHGKDEHLVRRKHRRFR